MIPVRASLCVTSYELVKKWVADLRNEPPTTTFGALADIRRYAEQLRARYGQCLRSTTLETQIIACVQQALQDSEIVRQGGGAL